MRAIDIDIVRCEDVANDRSRWGRDLMPRVVTRREAKAWRREARRKQSNKTTSGESVFKCVHSNWDCHSCVQPWQMLHRYQQLRHNSFGADPRFHETDRSHTYFNVVLLAFGKAWTNASYRSFYFISLGNMSIIYRKESYLVSIWGKTPSIIIWYFQIVTSKIS